MVYHTISDLIFLLNQKPISKQMEGQVSACFIKFCVLQSSSGVDLLINVCTV